MDDVHLLRIRALLSQAKYKGKYFDQQYISDLTKEESKLQMRYKKKLLSDLTEKQCENALYSEYENIIFRLQEEYSQRERKRADERYELQHLAYRYEPKGRMEKIIKQQRKEKIESLKSKREEISKRLFHSYPVNDAWYKEIWESIEKLKNEVERQDIYIQKKMKPLIDNLIFCYTCNHEKYEASKLHR